jgi:hypothetical protein
MCHEDMQRANHFGLRANDNFERTVPTCEPHPIHALAGGIVRSGEFVGLGSMMVKRATSGREATSAGGAEIR